MEKYHPGFIYTVEHIGVDGQVKSVETAYNLIPNLGVDYILGAAFKGTSQYTSWYLSVYGAARTPVASDTMVTLLAGCVEDTVYTITAGARPTIVFPAVVDGALTTSVSPNILAFASASTVRGALITTNVTRGNNAGLLISAVLFTSPKVMAAGETLRVPVGFALVST
jgi:hypothetical protein